MHRNGLFLLLTIFFLHLRDSLETKKCSTLLDSIPIQKKFIMSRFAGLWYTISRTKYVWGEDTYESASIEFSENDDGSFTYSLTGQLAKKCLPVETGSLQPGSRRGQFILKSSGTKHGNPTMIVSYTDYETALVYFCFRYRPGRKDQCQKTGWHAEIMSRSTKPREKVVKDYLKRMQKRLCVPSQDAYETKPGVCKIPEILAQAKEREIAQELVVDPGNKQCAVNNIPVQKGFQLSEMEGLWYELARTRFTFNKMESVISYHRYDSDNDLIRSFYTGTTDGNCSTPIQGSSRTKQGQDQIGNMEGKIDGDFFDWSPLKILYIDADYLMFYACYSGESDAACIKDLMEVTLVGRTREISKKQKNNIYKILPNICVDPKDMIDTKFTENCTAWVENVIKNKETDPSSCIYDEILPYDDFDDISMLGDWFLSAHTNFSSLNLMGNIINITRGPAQSLVIEQADFNADYTDASSCNRMGTMYTRPNCLDSGDFVTMLPGSNNRGLVFSKILYQDDNTFVNYICTQRNADGRCNIDGVHAFVYSKNQSLTDMSMENVNQALKSACLYPDDLLKVADWCSVGTLESGEETEQVDDVDEIKPENDFCDVDIDNINIFNDIDNFDQTRIYGYWYEIAHSSGIFNEDVESLTAFFTSDTNVTLQIYYSGILENGSVLPVERAMSIPRCLNELNGDYLTELPGNQNDSGTIAFAPMKVLFTDYDVLLTYICQEVLPTGQCSSRGAHIRLWSRNESMDYDTRDYVMDFATWACIDIYDGNYIIVDTNHDPSVLSVLEEYVLESVDVMGVQEEEMSNQANGQQADETETEFDDFEDSLRKYLEMTDDEFYDAQK